MMQSMFLAGADATLHFKFLAALIINYLFDTAVNSVVASCVKLRKPARLTLCLTRCEHGIDGRSCGQSWFQMYQTPCR